MKVQHLRNPNKPKKIISYFKESNFYCRSQNGLLCHGPETAVELPSDVSEAKIAEIAKWLQTDQMGSGFIDNTQSNIKIEPGIQLGGQITSTLSSPLPPTQLGPTQLGPVHNINFPYKRLSISPV